MRNAFSALFLSVVACTPLEDRIEIFDPEWCTDIPSEDYEDPEDPDVKGAPRRAAFGCPIDGDTFNTVGCEDQAEVWETIRLLGPDTPEKEGSWVGSGENRVQLTQDDCYAQEASDFLERVLNGRTLRLEFDETCMGDYGRRLAYVFITVEVDDAFRQEIDDFGDLIPDSDEAEDVLVNEWMLRAGISDIWPSFSTRNPDARYFDRLLEARETAALAELGGWGACKEDSHVFPNVDR